MIILSRIECWYAGHYFWGFKCIWCGKKRSDEETLRDLQSSGFRITMDDLKRAKANTNKSTELRGLPWVK